MISTEKFNPRDYGFEPYQGVPKKSQKSDYIIISKNGEKYFNTSLSLSPESANTIISELGKYVKPHYNKETGVFCIVEGDMKISTDRKGGRGTICINGLHDVLVATHGNFRHIYLDGTKFDNHPAFLFKPNGKRD